MIDGVTWKSTYILELEVLTSKLGLGVSCSVLGINNSISIWGVHLEAFLLNLTYLAKKESGEYIILRT